ncbi:unnamed protein product, partial [Mesorhabditis belari]|uniref:Uncharacterized protein n=1 Tax=Mesorhabditis belari TaxID=2138241 RepID=A0AAF3FHJ7_9BILA
MYTARYTTYVEGNSTIASAPSPTTLLAGMTPADGRGAVVNDEQTAKTIKKQYGGQLYSTIAKLADM